MYQQNGNFDYIFKLLLMGDSGVGKSSMLFRLCDDAFNYMHNPTIGIDFKIRTVEMDGKLIKLQIWDTAGQERYRSIVNSFYRGAMGVMLVYDITNYKTFHNLKNWIKDIEEHLDRDVVKVVVGHKCDLEKGRTVPFEKGQELAQKYRMHFIEASAKANINVDAAFIRLVGMVYEKATDEPTSFFRDVQPTLVYPNRPIRQNKSRCERC